MRRISSRSLVPLISVLAFTSCAAARAPVVESDRIAEALALREGMTVADVGAGDGRWSEALARQVGPSGRVYATEIDPDDVEQLRELAEREELINLAPILGDRLDTGLPDACCDGILLRLVYHHFTDPHEMRRSLGRALKPGGRIALIEIEPQPHWSRVEGVPDRGGHGILPEDLVDEMATDGFLVLERFDGWPGDQDRYCIVFGLASD